MRPAQFSVGFDFQAPSLPLSGFGYLALVIWLWLSDFGYLTFVNSGDRLTPLLTQSIALESRNS